MPDGDFGENADDIVVIAARPDSTPAASSNVSIGADGVRVRVPIVRAGPFTGGVGGGVDPISFQADAEVYGNVQIGRHGSIGGNFRAAAGAEGAGTTYGVEGEANLGNGRSLTVGVQRSNGDMSPGTGLPVGGDTVFRAGVTFRR